MIALTPLPQSSYGFVLRQSQSFLYMILPVDSVCREGLGQGIRGDSEEVEQHEMENKLK